MARGALTTRRAKLVAFWLPIELLEELDQHVNREDLDRSKVIRAALKERLIKKSPRPDFTKEAA
jgi:metal-responsive CopG/Arc/MetJ family transcriptional regulator